MDAISELKDKGYVILKNVFPESELVPMRQLTEDIIEYGEKNLEDPFSPYFMRHRTDQGALYDLYYRHPEFQRMAQTPVILDTLEGVLGRDIFLYENSLVYKPKGKNNEVPWHQDFINRSHEPTKYIVWIAFDNVTIENGAMKVLPGSHKLGFLPWYHVPGETHHTRLQLEGVDTEAFEHTIMNAGDVLIFHQLTIHSSDRIASTQPRRAFRYATQGFDAIFTPRAVPVVLRGGRPQALTTRFPKPYEAPQAPVPVPQPPPPSFLRRAIRAVGRRMANV